MHILYLNGKIGFPCGHGVFEINSYQNIKLALKFFYNFLFQYIMNCLVIYIWG